MTKKKTPQILKTDTALKLAEKWVANMSMPAEDDPIEAQQEARPPRKLEANMSLQRLQTECHLGPRMRYPACFNAHLTT
ncbi:uncharacterized protein LOC106380617 isoform X2 [Brassica napus]|uniref:uncharacterized protein LOC106380617 isoform X2 n=1 Tax=Brassica napus TaxID=3708 RepID=UPI0020793C51|nr:uncharacterized protein LOC106380617 isoform X2 [Brassica napus]